MIKVSVLYPDGEGKTFDHDYYRESHMPMVARVVGEALKGYHIERGVAGGTSDSPPPFLALGHLLFDSVEAYDAAFGPHAKEIMADIPNYTDIRPTLQISHVVEQVSLR
jgi:uncharacterized protein (TIGR02118 family)